MARWLNGVLVDWPPIHEDYDGPHMAHHRQMLRRLAREALDVAAGKPGKPAT